MPTKLNREDLPEVERQELERILDLPKANRSPTETDIKFLKDRTDYIDDGEIKQFSPEVAKLFFYSEKELEEIEGKPQDREPLKNKEIKELRAIAKAEGIKLGLRLRKATIIKVIEKARK